MTVLLEVCVDDAAGVAAAVAGGADRIELCSALALGGLSPSAGLIGLAAGCGVPVFAMVRPRQGVFCWSPTEVGMMEAEINAVRQAGLAGVVLGASLADGRLDLSVLRRLVARAGGMGLTLHRCFDLVPDPFEALEQAVALGFHRILTSGLAETAPLGADLLRRLMERAAGRIGILPGGGIGPETVAALAGLPLREVHASCGVAMPQTGRVVDLGFAQPVRRQTDAGRIRALRHALAGHGQA